MPTLHWIGKDKVINHHREIPYRLLKKEYVHGSDTSENKIIRGDNLEALKSLLPEYRGRVKCIYIDPPYNTGNEGWIYNDNVNDPKMKRWLHTVVGKEGEDLSRHDKWLCMMYPHLRLLHELLAPDGVIFVSINFMHEHANLRLVMDEIFGNSNCLGEITWESTTQPINSGSARFGLQQKVEPIIFYAKDIKRQNGFILEELDSGLRYPHAGKLGACRFEIIEKSDAGAYERKTMKFPILG
ncbi:site-specific DNA-methyltransferase [Candidatus Gracilibacteria bacterium]|nr:site-specific DNA-methyltransferase [Candidatus Gracilibacteria bacterium]